MSTVITTGYNIVQAVWGWNVSGTTTCGAVDVTSLLVNWMNQNPSSYIPCNTSTFGDPSSGNRKSFSAIIGFPVSGGGYTYKFISVPEGTNLSLTSNCGAPTPLS